MFEIDEGGEGRIRLKGRFDASQVDKVREVLNEISDSSVIDFEALEYISSAGLGVLLGAQKRLRGTGNSLKLINMNRHIREIFRIAGFDHVFDID